MTAREVFLPVGPLSFGLDASEPTKCPCCGDQYLHHGRIVVRSRVREDEPGVEVVIGGGAVHVETRGSGGFAGRRDDFRIEWWCEGCAMAFALVVKQHKGCTYSEIVTLGPAREMEP
jgi:hypothetical protein